MGIEQGGPSQKDMNFKEPVPTTEVVRPEFVKYQESARRSNLKDITGEISSPGFRSKEGYFPFNENEKGEITERLIKDRNKNEVFIKNLVTGELTAVDHWIWLNKKK